MQARTSEESHFIDILANGAAGFGFGFNEKAKFRAARYGL